MIRYLLTGLILATLTVAGQIYINSPALGNTNALSPQSLSEVSIAPTGQIKESRNLQLDQATLGLATTASAEGAAENTSWSSEPDGIDPQPVAQAPWTEQADPPSTPERYQHKGVDARPLKMNAAAIKTVVRGDSIRLPIPHTGEQFDMVVEQVGKHQNGDLSLRGYLQNENRPYPVIMTQGDSSTFATINTPSGSFMLEATGEQAWMMSLAELDYLIDPNLIDYKIPAIER